MSENLIYGADLTCYGAISDNKTDCSIALNKAIEDRQSLISIPYGNYIFKNPVTLKSNVKLCVHPKATLTFKFDKKDEPCVNAKAQSGIIIEGGIWINKTKCDLFCFESVNNLTLSGLEIQADTSEDAICLKGVNSFKLKNLCGYTQKAKSFIKLSSICSDAVIKNIKAVGFDKSLCANGKDTNISNVYAHGLCFEKCGTLLHFDNSVQNVSRVSVSDINGSFYNNALCVMCKTDDLCIDDIFVYALSKSDDAPCYLLIDGDCQGLEISGFKRDTLYECIPHLHTAIISSKKDCSCIIDGLLLDNIIMSKSLSKDISMTAAKLSSPHPKYTYTVELNLKAKQVYTLFGGDFETLSM